MFADKGARDSDHPVFREHADALLAYVLEQGDAAQALREHRMPDVPFPAVDNVMLRYLVRRAETDIFQAMTRGDADSVTKAVLALAAHAWFEGGLDRTADLDHALRAGARRPTSPDKLA